MNAGSRTIRFNPTDPAFRELVAELKSVPGIYWYEYNGVTLKVGQSGKREGRDSGIGSRLSHHVTVAFKDQASHRSDFPGWHAFMTALLDRLITVRWQECSRTDVDAIEKAAIRDAPGGVLWEQLKSANLALKRDPSGCAAFTRQVQEMIDARSPDEQPPVGPGGSEFGE